MVTNLKKPEPAGKDFKLPKTIQVSKLSQESQEVLKHFGLEALSKLHTYCISLEDALLDQTSTLLIATREIKKLQAQLSEFQMNK